MWQRGINDIGAVSFLRLKQHIVIVPYYVKSNTPLTTITQHSTPQQDRNLGDSLTLSS